MSSPGERGDCTFMNPYSGLKQVSSGSQEEGYYDDDDDDEVCFGDSCGAASAALRSLHDEFSADADWYA